ncbi:MAG: hypothetical protein A3J80_00870 [Desulfobacula sp. RIFOXYB2_FULL_45_6]|nr:MAG: hypothetical protein A3J80_00870 [Desulfobacula sp. RIFOXYB2_FULL_45_6]
MQHQVNIDPYPPDTLKSGEIMVKEGMIRMDDIDTVLSIQKKKQDSVSFEKKRLFGMVLCDLNLITPLDNYCVLRRHKKLMSIQSALVLKKMMPRDRVTEILKESQNKGIPFISNLITKKCVSAAGMQTLLFELFHVPFRSISDFIFNDRDREILVKIMDKKTSMDKKILPLMIKTNTLLFGITDPENILFIHQLNDGFPQYRFKAMFIPFSGFTWFYRIIYEGIAGLPEKKPPDLSLLLNFKTSIREPEKEKEAILSLYHRYEQVRVLTEHPKRGNLQQEFIDFIIHHHNILMTKYQSRSIEFSLKKDGTGVKVAAFPEI